MQLFKNEKFIIVDSFDDEISAWSTKKEAERELALLKERWKDNEWYTNGLKILFKWDWA